MKAQRRSWLVESGSLLIILSAALAQACAGRGTVGPREWTITAPRQFGIITTIVRCEDDILLIDNTGTIYPFDIAAHELRDTVRAPIPLVTAAAADCDQRRLYLVSSIPIRGKNAVVYAVNRDSGAIHREYPLPPQFLPRYGARLIGHEELLVPGLWVAPDFPVAALLERVPTDYYEGLRLGVRLDLVSGEAEPLLVPYETRCIGGGQCPEVRVDSDGTGTRYLASLPTATSVGVYDSTASYRAVDIRSPRFVRDGSVLEIRAHVDERMAWLGRNSTVDRIVAFGNVFAVIHVLHRVGPNWKMGQPAPADAYLNVYTWDGRQKTVDVPVPRGFNMGFDDRHLYAVDYGPDGPRAGLNALTFLQIPVDF